MRAANIHDTTVELANEGGWIADKIPFSFVERYQAAYTAEIHKFLDFLEKGEAPRASGHDGLMAQKLAEAASESLSTGQVVTVR